MRRSRVSADLDTRFAIAQLDGEPLATNPGTRPSPGEALDFSSDALKTYRDELARRRDDFRQWLRANAPRAEITHEYDIVLNAVAIRLNGEELETILAAPMVKSAQYTRIHRPTDAGERQQPTP